MPPTPPGPVRCPACGQQALPLQSRCLHCNARLNEVLPVKPSDAVPAVLLPVDGKCPECGKELAEGAVLCIECGYDLRTGRKRTTRHARAEEEPEPQPRRKLHVGPLPLGLSYVQLGLGFHYARLVLTLLVVLALMASIAYAGLTKAQPGDLGLLVAALALIGLVLLAAVLGLLGSIFCLWVGRASRAWGFIFASLVLDLLTVPLGVYLQIASLPPWISCGVIFVSWILFMLFLQRLALYLDRPGEANELMTLIVRGIALVVAVPLLLILLGMVAMIVFPSPGVLIVLLMVVIVVVQFIYLVKLFFSILGTIQTLRATIASRLGSRREESD
jgi:hypothetical protein